MEITDAVFIPLIIGLVEMFKRLGLPVKYAPVIAVLIGVLVGILYMDIPLKDGIIIGLVFGLSASGLYSGTKHLVHE